MAKEVFLLKNIHSSTSPKYSASDYEPVCEDIFLHNGQYITCLSFQQEAKYGEGHSAAEISQFSLEDLLDRFSVYISDSFKNLNTPDTTICCLEFSGCLLEDILHLRSIIGKHVYNCTVQDGGIQYVELVIE